MIQRQRRRRPIHHSTTTTTTSRTVTGPFLLAGMACTTMLCLWSVGALLVATYSSSSSSSSSLSLSSPLLRLRNGQSFPTNVWDVWPTSSNVSDGMNQWLSSCYPADDPDKCRILVVNNNNNNNNNHNNKRQIAILRLPGQLGFLMETYLHELLATWKTKDTDTTNQHDHNDDYDTFQTEQPQDEIQLVATSDVSVLNQQHVLVVVGDKKLSQPTVAQIIRPVVLPPLLEALDLILQTQNVNDETTTTTTFVSNGQSTLSSSSLLAPTMPELQAVLQQVLRWHCHVAQQTEHRARMTILLDETTIYPKVIGEDVANFLNLSFDVSKNTVHNMNDLAIRLIQRLGQTWHLARNIWNRVQKDDHNSFWARGLISKEEWVDRIVQNELRLQMNQTCLSPLDVYPKTRVTELIGTFLSGKSIAAVCQSYPESIICQEERTYSYT